MSRPSPLTRRRAGSLFDLVPWEGIVAPGVLANADGAFVAAFAFRGPDLEAATAAEIAALRGALERALGPLGTGWAIHLALHRREAPGYPPEGAFPDPFTRALDEERRRRYEGRGARYRSAGYLTLTYRPDRLERSGLGRLLGPEPLDAGRQEAALERFAETLEEIEGLLATQLAIDRLASAELLVHLYRSLTFRRESPALGSGPVSLEALLGGAGDLALGLEVASGEIAVVPVGVVGYPPATRTAGLDFLNDLDLPLHAVWRFLPLDLEEAKQAVTRRRTHWATAGLDLRTVLAWALRRGGEDERPSATRRHGSAMVADADEALYELERDQLPVGYMTTTVLLFDADRAVARERAGRVARELRSRGYVATVERYNAPHAFLGSLPGCGRYNHRRPLATLANYLDMAVTTAVWTGAATHPHPVLAGAPPHVVASTSGSTPFYLSLAHHDVQHALVVGPTGSGKSTLVNLLLAQYLRYPRAQVFAIDRGWSMLATTLAAGGHHYPLSVEAAVAQGGHRFAPLARLDTARQRQVAGEWLEDLLACQGVRFTPALRSRLERAVELVATTSRRTLGNLAAKLQETTLRDALRPYAPGGAYGELFDGTEDPLRSGALHVFEMERVVALKGAVVTPLLLHLFAEIERRLDGRPTLILVEEALPYLGDTRWARRFRQWLYELRKRNAGVVFVAQSLGAFLASELREAVLESCPTRIFLPNPAARESQAREAYRAFGLNDRQVEIVAAATPRRDYYVTSPAGSRRVDLDLTPASLAVLGLAGPEARRTVAAATATHGDAWLAGYLAGQGHHGFVRLLEEAARKGGEDA